jgi:pantetheine-phosphate adenylyltransferase
MSTVLYPGSFDPFHLGHLDVVEQATALFGDVVVAVMHNPDKPSGVMSTDQRVSLIVAACAHLPHVTVRSFPGLAVDAALSVNALCIVKGLRTSGVRTVYVPCQPRFGFVSSRFIRDIAAHGGDVSSMVPSSVSDALTSLFPPRSK